MIELIIKIPESEIPKKQEVVEIPLHFIDGKVCEAGGYEFDVLLKGHGDLIDRSKLLIELECGIRAGNYEEGYEKYPHINDMDDCFDTVKYADTIIEADEGSQNYWAKGFFKGKCPYTGKKCEDWNCNECEVEKAEREWMEE